MTLIPDRKTLMFICTHNSARSQMAEGIVNAWYGDRYEACSAGTQPTTVHPLAVRVMAELGLDISHQRAKSIQEFRGKRFDIVVTVCDHAKATCPFFPGAKRYLHHDFPDPSETAGANAGAATDALALERFRHTRDAIEHWLEMIL